MKINKIISIIVLVSCSLILSSCFKPNPAKISEKFVRLMDKGEVNKAITLLYSDSTQIFGEDKTNLALYKGVEILQKPDEVNFFKVNNETVKGDFATVKYTIKYKDESEKNGVFKLIKKDRKWKIDRAYSL